MKLTDETCKDEPGEPARLFAFLRLSGLTYVVRCDNIASCEWRKLGKRARSHGSRQQLKDFESFPKEAQSTVLTALTIAAEGSKADIAKPLHGLGSGVFEVALKFCGDAFRLVYAVQLAEEIWVIHAFQKKSKQGIKTPKHEIDLVRDRLRRLKEALR